MFIFVNQIFFQNIHCNKFFEKRITVPSSGHYLYCKNIFSNLLQVAETILEKVIQYVILACIIMTWNTTWPFVDRWSWIPAAVQ